MAHHHLAVVIFIVAGHMYRTNFCIGHRLEAILDAHTVKWSFRCRSQRFATVNNSLHFQLALALASIGTITSMVAQHIYSLPPYAYLAIDFTTSFIYTPPIHCWFHYVWCFCSWCYFLNPRL
jgi:photosystem I P700 chlorophyll a apoprotein A2